MLQFRYLSEWGRGGGVGGGVVFFSGSEEEPRKLMDGLNWRGLRWIAFAGEV